MCVCACIRCDMCKSQQFLRKMVIVRSEGLNGAQEAEALTHSLTEDG